MALAEQSVKTCRPRAPTPPKSTCRPGATCRIDVRNGALETVEEAASQGVGVRVFVKGRMAFASCNDFAPASLDERRRPRHRVRAGPRPPTRTTCCRPTPGRPPVEGLYDPAIAKIADGAEDRDGDAGSRSAGDEGRRASPRAPAPVYGEREVRGLPRQLEWPLEDLQVVVVLAWRVGRGREGGAEVVGRRVVLPAVLRGPPAAGDDRGACRRPPPSNCSTRGW